MQLLTVGRLTQVKGQAVMLQALAELKARGCHVRLEIVGDGPKREALERLAAQLGLGDRVRFAGAVGQGEIGGYYDRADAFVLSSFAEGIPVVLMEAMASELPVVAPGVMGVGELVRDGVNGRVVRPGRHEQLADAIESLAGDPARCRAFGVAARETVMGEFDIARSAEQLAGLFDRYAGAGSPARDESAVQ
jgi:glycosyltransferase involved in cell wall biosynthesis